MSFSERDKDYFFGLLENILKCLYVEASSYGNAISRKNNKEVTEFMKRFNLLED